MEMGRARLPPEERERRMREGRCLYCGELGHRLATCSARTRRISRSTNPVGSTTRTLTPVQVKHHTCTIDMEALIDSGADESLMDERLAKHLGLRTRRLEKPVKASSLNGQELFTITHATEPVLLNIAEHKELLSFYLYQSDTRNLVLGYPWLVRHNPHIDWSTGRVMTWAQSCQGRCLPTTTTVTMINTLSAQPTTDSQYPDLTAVPRCYHHLKEVFNKAKADISKISICYFKIGLL